MNTTDEASVARMMQQHADYFFNLTAVKGKEHAEMLLQLADVLIAVDLIVGSSSHESRSLIKPALQTIMEVTFQAVQDNAKVPSEKFTEVLEEACVIAETITLAARRN